ncbi:MAG TPA: hypothetical protein VKZ53_16660 [Candidatus Angelobacter sp.]|nr:hypothetical protein [Candidatus Angelobacter sp.]
MPQPHQLELTWCPREIPLLPVAVAARGEASLRLANRLLQFDNDHLSRLEGIAGARLLAVMGVAESLPWVDGVQYLGVDSEAPTLLLPTTYRPSLPVELVARALQGRLRQAGSTATGTIVVLPAPLLLVSMQKARPISRATLASWLERQ